MINVVMIMNGILLAFAIVAFLFNNMRIASVLLFVISCLCLMVIITDRQGR